MTRPSLVPFADAPEDSTAAAVAMRDGTKLHTEVYLPRRAQAGVRVPAVLVRAPYGVREEFMMLPGIARFVTERGMAMVVQDVRGKFRSEGERLPFFHEVLDGYDTLEWIVAQRWSSGAVGMYGESYYGFTQWAALASGHPALRAMTPLVTGSEVPTWFARPGTVPFLAAPLGWLASCWDSASMFERDEAEVLDFARAPVLSIVEAFPHARDLASRLLVAPDAGLLATTYPHGLPALGVSIPVLHRGGWWDNLKGSQLDDWRAVQSAPGAAFQRLEMAAMDHYSEPFRLPGSDYPLANDALSQDKAIERIVGTAVLFLEQHLGVRDVVSGPRVRVEVANAGWLEADEWPVRSAAMQAWYLCDASSALSSADGGGLRPTSDRAITGVTVSHRPDDLVPSLAISDFHVLPDIPDETDVHARCDVATFTSDPLQGNTDIVGEVRAQIRVGASAEIVPLVLGLHHVTAESATLITEGSLNASLGNGEQLVTVDLGATAYRVRAGDRLRLSVSVTRFPRYLPPSGTLESAWLSSDRRPIDLDIRVGAGTGTRLLVPVLPSGQVQ
jgi:hypothetical protein